MKISEIKDPLVRELAEKRAKQLDKYDFNDKEHVSNSHGNREQLIFAFDWEKTPEGFHFWNRVKDEQDVSHYDCYPRKHKPVKVKESPEFNNFCEKCFTCLNCKPFCDEVTIDGKRHSAMFDEAPTGKRQFIGYQQIDPLEPFNYERATFMLETAQAVKEKSKEAETVILVQLREMITKYNK